MYFFGQQNIYWTCTKKQKEEQKTYPSVLCLYTVFKLICNRNQRQSEQLKWTTNGPTLGRGKGNRQKPEFLKVAIIKLHDCAKFLRIWAKYLLINTKQEKLTLISCFVTIWKFFKVCFVAFLWFFLHKLFWLPLYFRLQTCEKQKSKFILLCVFTCLYDY